jgi:putative SOS response-associated peptidase YedK
LSKGGEPVESRTPITTRAIEVVAPVLDRMPVLLAPEDYERWLDPRNREPEALNAFSRSYPAGGDADPARRPGR